MCKLSALMVGVGLVALLGACGGGGIAVQPVAVSDDITAPTTWSPNTAIDCDYLVSANKEIEVKAALTVLPGTKVCFAAGSGLKTTATGSLTAVGTASSRIVFTGATASKGFWKGLAFGSNNPANELTYADVLFAGNAESFCCDFFEPLVNIQAAVLVGSNLTSGASLKMTNSLVASSGGFGLFVFRNHQLSGFSLNAFSANSKAPVALPIAQVGKLDAASNYAGSGAGLSSNSPNAVQVNESPAASTNVAQTVLKLEVPYAMFLGDAETEQEYQGALTIQAGARLEFEANTGLEIMPTGSLNAVGTVADPVVFTGRVATKGFWKGLAFRSNNPLNRLERSVVDFAGSEDDFCCDYFEATAAKSAIIVGANGLTSATLSLVNSTVRNSDNFGVYRFPGNTVTASGNTYTGNDSGNNPPGLL